MSDKNVDKAIELGMKSKYLEGVLDGIAASTKGLRNAMRNIDDATLAAMTKREIMDAAIEALLRQRARFEIELADISVEFDQLSPKVGDGEVLQ